LWRLDAFARARLLNIPAQMSQQWNSCGKPTCRVQESQGIGPAETLHCLRKLFGMLYGSDAIQYKRGSLKLYILCSVSVQKVYDQLFFVGLTMTGIPFHEMLTKWLLLQFLNESISHHWTGQTADRSDFTEVASKITWPLLNSVLCVCHHHREIRNIWNSIATKVAQIDRQIIIILNLKTDRQMLKKRMVRCGILGWRVVSPMDYTQE
jgi:hypothetical protein